MASITGVNGTAAYKIATTVGTAVAVGAGNKLKAEITPDFGSDILQPRQIGSGATMIQSAPRGNYKPTLKLAMDAGYRNCMDNIIAQFMGTAAAPSEQTASQGDYKHTITASSVINAKYGTLVFEDSSATVQEYPTTCTQGIEISLDDSPGILQFNADLLATSVTLAGTVNNNAAVQAATATDVEVIAFDNSDLFRLNTNAGAGLSGSDNLSITGFKLNLTKPQSIKSEIKGAAGNSAPLSDGMLTGTLSITLKELADHTFYTYWQNETALKCSLNIQGTQIGSGVNRAITIYIPKMLLINEPKYAHTQPGVNPYTMNFQIIEATANPTGMTSKQPYFEIINNLSTSLLA